MELPGSAETSSFDEAVVSRLVTKITANGQITFPAVPALLDDYVDRCTEVFASVGREFSDEERDHLRSVLEGVLDAAYRASQRSTVTVHYESVAAGALSYNVVLHAMTIEEAYHHWVATREPPLFGIHPDARVWALAAEAADPAGHRILDIGGGTGRNALALARRGHPVDVVELTAKFAEMIREEAAKESLDVRVVQRDFFETDDDLRRDYSLILLSEVVPEFRTPEPLRQLFEKASQCLVPGGRLVFNIFLTEPDYEPSPAARQFAEQAYSAFFTPAELAEAVEGLPFDLEADDCVFDYEMENLPEGAWPPTGWYGGWVSGSDIYGLGRDCPVDMHWLVYRRR